MKLTPYRAAIGATTAAAGAAALTNLDWVQSVLVSPSLAVTTGTVVGVGSLAVGAVTAAWNRSFNTFGRFAAAASIALLAPHLVAGRPASAPGVPVLTRNDIPGYTMRLATAFSTEAEARRAEALAYQNTIADLRQRLIMVESSIRKELEPALAEERTEIASRRREIEEERKGLVAEKQAIADELAKAEAGRAALLARVQAAEGAVAGAQSAADARVAAAELKAAQQIKQVTEKSVADMVALRATVNDSVMAKVEAAVASLDRSEKALADTAAATATRTGDALKTHGAALDAQLVAISKVPELTAAAVGRGLSEATTTLGKQAAVVGAAGDRAEAAADRASKATLAATEAFREVPAMVTAFQAASNKLAAEMPNRVATAVDGAVARGVETGTRRIETGLAEARTEVAGLRKEGQAGQARLESGLSAVSSRMDGFVKTTEAAVSTVVARVDSIGVATQMIKSALGTEISNLLLVVGAKQDTLSAHMTAVETNTKAVAAAQQAAGTTLQDLVQGSGVLRERVTRWGEETGRLAGVTAKMGDDYSTQAAGVRLALAGAAATNSALDAKLTSFTVRFGANNDAITRSVGAIEAGMRNQPRAATPAASAGAAPVREAAVAPRRRDEMPVASPAVGAATVIASARTAPAAQPNEGQPLAGTQSGVTEADAMFRNLVKVTPAARPEPPAPPAPLLRVTAAPASIATAAQQAWIAPPLKMPSCKRLSLTSRDGWDVAVAVAYPGYLLDSIDPDGGFVWATAPNGTTTALPMLEISRLSGCKTSQTASR